jgi:hypothetical protein
VHLLVLPAVAGREDAPPHQGGVRLSGCGFVPVRRGDALARGDGALPRRRGGVERLARDHAPVGRASRVVSPRVSQPAHRTATPRPGAVSEDGDVLRERRSARRPHPGCQLRQRTGRSDAGFGAVRIRLLAAASSLCGSHRPAGGRRRHRHRHAAVAACRHPRVHRHRADVRASMRARREELPLQAVPPAPAGGPPRGERRTERITRNGAPRPGRGARP